MMDTDADTVLGERYNKLRTCWSRGPDVNIRLEGQLDFEVRIPVNWLARSGNNTWSLVKEMLNILVKENGYLAADVDGHVPLNLLEVPIEGSFHFLPEKDATNQSEHRMTAQGKSSYVVVL